MALSAVSRDEEPTDPDGCMSFMDVEQSREVELVSIDLSPEEASPLIERGILPGCLLCRIRMSPFGDPVVSADGMCFALRKETAQCLRVRAVDEPEA